MGVEYIFTGIHPLLSTDAGLSATVVIGEAAVCSWILLFP